MPNAVINSLISMYSKCGNFNQAVAISFHSFFLSFSTFVILPILFFNLNLFSLHLLLIHSIWLPNIFEEYKTRNKERKAQDTWTTMIYTCRVNGLPKIAFQYFYEMINNGIIPNKYSYSNILSMIAETPDLTQVQNIHQQLQVLIIMKKNEKKE